MLLNCYCYVSERYRDLIEAADTITAMKQSADSVWQFLMSIFSLFATSTERDIPHPFPWKSWKYTTKWIFPLLSLLHCFAMLDGRQKKCSLLQFLHSPVTPENNSLSSKTWSVIIFANPLGGRGSSGVGGLSPMAFSLNIHQYQRADGCPGHRINCTDACFMQRSQTAVRFNNAACCTLNQCRERFCQVRSTLSWWRSYCYSYTE